MENQPAPVLKDRRFPLLQRRVAMTDNVEQNATAPVVESLKRAANGSFG
jgi:hypothetical protein